MKFTTINNRTFEVNITGKQIRRTPDNTCGCWKSFARISKPKVGSPVVVVWEVDSKDNALRSTLTSIVKSVNIDC